MITFKTKKKLESRLIEPREEGLPVNEIYLKRGGDFHGYTVPWCVFPGSVGAVWNQKTITLRPQLGGTVNTRVSVSAGGDVVVHGHAYQSEYGWHLRLGTGTGYLMNSCQVTRQRNTADGYIIDLKAEPVEYKQS